MYQRDLHHSLRRHQHLRPRSPRKPSQHHYCTPAPAKEEKEDFAVTEIPQIFENINTATIVGEHRLGHNTTPLPSIVLSACPVPIEVETEGLATDDIPQVDEPIAVDTDTIVAKHPIDHSITYIPLLKSASRLAVPKDHELFNPANVDPLAFPRPSPTKKRSVGHAGRIMEVQYTGWVCNFWQRSGVMSVILGIGSAGYTSRPAWTLSPRQELLVLAFG
ncbi:hypothetical protein WAI453_006846 [Rhynchosporium graminicola]